MDTPCPCSTLDWRDVINEATAKGETTPDHHPECVIARAQRFGEVIENIAASLKPGFDLSDYLGKPEQAMTLPPARYQLCLPLPRLCCIKAEIQVAAQETIDALFDSFRKALAFLDSLVDFHSPPSRPQPSLRYAAAGYPHGNHTRGKKRWLLEQKRRTRHHG